MSDPHDIVCVFKSPSAAQAELVRNLLEAEGIRAASGDTNNPFPGLTIAPAEVFVERSNEERALAIIAAAQHHHLHEDESAESDDDDSNAEAE